jgi:hypothetical protein
MSEPIYNIRTGDLLESSKGFGIVVQVTSKNILYFYLADKHGGPVSNCDGAKIEKQFLWEKIEEGEATLHYSPSMKYRRKRKKEQEKH